MAASSRRLVGEEALNRAVLAVKVAPGRLHAAHRGGVLARARACRLCVRVDRSNSVSCSVEVRA